MRHSVLDGQAREAIEAEFERNRHAVADADAQRFSAETSRKSGMATEGLEPVCVALRDGAVDTLMVGDLADRTVVADSSLGHIAPNADVLSEWGTASHRLAC